MKEKSKSNLILISIISLILGIILIVSTDKILEAFNYIFVCIFSIAGIIEILNFILNKNYKENNYFNLILGIIFIWLALIIYKYYMMFIILPMLFSLYLFITGAFLIIKYFNFKKELKKKVIKDLIIGIVSIIIGIFLILEPKLPMYTYLKITGVNIIIIAILLILELIEELRKKND